MSDEKQTPAQEPAGESVEQAPKEVVAPVPVKKSDPADELAETVDQFFAGIQAASVRSMKSILMQFREKADDVIAKLDVEAPKNKP